MRREVGSYDEDNAETARFAGDDVGLPESPIFSNYSKNLWRTHTRHGLVQSPDRSHEGTSDHPSLGGHEQPAGGRPADKTGRGRDSSRV